MPNRFSRLAVFSILIIVGSAGCQTSQQVPSQRLIEHQALIDFSGLREPEMAEAVSVQVSVPQSWPLQGVEKKSLYNHQQWKSPSGRTGVGVIYVKLPIPLSSDTVVWLAIKHYAKQASDGREIGRWEDALGRKWFEAETSKYHARGYVIVNGLNAWIIYSGFKTSEPPEPGEISLAARSIDSFIPVTPGEQVPVATPATQPSMTSTLPSPTSKPAE